MYVELYKHYFVAVHLYNYNSNLCSIFIIVMKEGK